MRNPRAFTINNRPHNFFIDIWSLAQCCVRILVRRYFWKHAGRFSKNVKRTFFRDTDLFPLLSLVCLMATGLSHSNVHQGFFLRGQPLNQWQSIISTTASPWSFNVLRRFLFKTNSFVNSYTILSHRLRDNSVKFSLVCILWNTKRFSAVYLFLLVTCYMVSVTSVPLLSLTRHVRKYAKHVTTP